MLTALFSEVLFKLSYVVNSCRMLPLYTRDGNESDEEFEFLYFDGNPRLASQSTTNSYKESCYLSFTLEKCHKLPLKAYLSLFMKTY